MKPLSDKEIGRWSAKKFKTTIAEQYHKYCEERAEMMTELADMWIVICGLKARGSKRQFPDYELFCKLHSVKPIELRRLINKKIELCNKQPYFSKQGVLKRMKTPEEIKAIMLKKAEERGVVPTPTLDKIANFRASRNIPVDVCPCSSSEEEKKKRGCISDMCFREIQQKGICKCGCYTRQGFFKK